MRQITITAPEGRAADIARIAFEVGIPQVSIGQTRIMKPDGSETTKDRVEIDTATDRAKAFIDEVTTASFFVSEHCSIAVRQPRSIITGDGFKALIRPLVEPATDLFEELGQFCQITYGFVGRIFIGALLLGLGIHDDRLLLMIAGLLFIPLLPLILAIGFGLCTRKWSILLQGAVSLAVALLILMIAGIIVALTSNGPVRYSEFNSVLSGFLISLAVGVAAALASSDDVGRREMIGLAATAQVAIIPVWFGVCFISGFPVFTSAAPSQRIVSLLINIGAIAFSSYGTYALLGMKGKTLRIFNNSPRQSDKRLTSKP